MTGRGQASAGLILALGGAAVSLSLSACGGRDRLNGEQPGAAAVDAVTPVPGLPPSETAEDSNERLARWRAIATTEDRARLRTWRNAWVDALAQVPPRIIAADPDLFTPDRALPGALPSPGMYRCRTHKLGAIGSPGSVGGGDGGRGRSILAYTGYDWFSCRIDTQGRAMKEGGLGFVKLGGSQRPVGIVYPATAKRAIFLGTMMLADERRAMRYGMDSRRNMAGIVERIGERRWRIVLPYPQFESLLDVVELAPAD